MRQERVLCLYVPHFRVLAERWRRPELATEPVVVHHGGKRPLVLEGCALAARSGVREGMLLSRALSLCPQATVLPADEEYYRRLHRESLLPLLRLTPEVSAPSLGLAFMEARGLERLVGDERALAHWVMQEWEGFAGARGLGLEGDGESPAGEAQVGVAAGHFAAAMAAMHGGRPATLVAPGKEAAFLAPLSLEVLPAPDSDWREMLRRLRLLGLDTLGDVARLGRVAVQAQFGLPGLQAWRLAANDPQGAAVFPGAGVYRCTLVLPEVEAGRQYEPALVSQGDLETALRALTEEVARGLRRDGWSSARLRVSWRVEARAEEAREMSLKEPSALAADLLGAARRCLPEAMEGPVVELGVRAEALAPQAGKQLTLFQKRKAGQRLAQVGAELQKRLGRAVLYQVQTLGPSHLEERTFALAPR
ncbi:MAG: hypothetical protein GX605_01940 [Chloroflexi bacterium]|nr:hypothetical protein [Chloroflexota bacterium]